MLFQHASPPDTEGGLVKTCVSGFNSKPYGTIESLGTAVVTTYWCLGGLDLCYSNMLKHLIQKQAW
jgi:hypothetical protein